MDDIEYQQHVKDLDRLIGELGVVPDKLIILAIPDNRLNSQNIKHLGSATKIFIIKDIQNNKLYSHQLTEIEDVHRIKSLLNKLANGVVPQECLVTIEDAHDLLSLLVDAIQQSDGIDVP